MAMTKEQAVALAQARRRRAEAGGGAVPAATPTMEQEMTALADDNVKGIQAGIGRSAMKTVRGIGTTLLPEFAEKWAEQKGYLPTERDIELLGKTTAASTPGAIAEGTGDVLTAIAPALGASRAATAATKAAPRLTQAAAQIGAGAASGAATEGMLAEDNVADAALRGGMWGAGGEAAPRVAGALLSRVVPSTAATKALMKRGITPTLGQGADPNTIRGGLVKTLEEAAQVAPISGMALRSSRDKASRQLFDEAVRTVDPTALTKGNMQEVVENLGTATSKAYREPLDKVKLPFNKGTLGGLQGKVDDIAIKNNLDPNTTARIQSEIELLHSGVRGRKGPLSAVEDMAESIVAAGGTGAEKKTRNEIASLLRGTVDNAAAAAGKPLADVRKARAGYHVLSKATPSGAKASQGVSAERLISALRKNDKRMGKGMTPELRQLAEEATGIEPAARAFGASTPSRLFSGLAGMGELAAGVGTGGLAPLGLGVYGVAQRTALPRLLLGDQATKDAFVNALRNPAIRGTILGLEEE